MYVCNENLIPQNFLQKFCHYHTYRAMVLNSIWSLIQVIAKG